MTIATLKRPAPPFATPAIRPLPPGPLLGADLTRPLSPAAVTDVRAALDYRPEVRIVERVTVVGDRPF